MTVGIVGLGIAGLRAAQLLERQGVNVRLYEARNRLGGRMHTVAEDGAVFESGGEWIDADHHRFMSLLREHGLEPLAPPDFPRHYLYRDERCSSENLWQDVMEDDLRVEGAAREICRSLTTPPWVNLHASKLEARTLGDFLRANTRSERGLWWLTATYRSDEGDDPDNIGLFGWLSGYLQYLNRDGNEMSAFRVPGGSSQLFKRMAARLTEEPRLGSRLRRLEQDGQGVTLDFDQARERVERVILTMPPSALEHVVFDPPLDSSKRCAIEACGMSRAIKLSWQFDQPWWLEYGWGGSMICDSPLQQLWDATLGEAPVMSAYICGRAAEEWLSLPDPVSAGLYELSRLYPVANDHFVKGWVHDWISDPFSGGAFSHLAPGYVLDHMEHIAPPEGRVHFAGEHTATWTGFIEGALESAERVVAEVLA